jgi:KaiC/GvpD/RAD55 family RecA-like ATPase
MLKWSLDGSGSLILVGGDPGVGKSTLLLQVLSQMPFSLDYFLMFVVWMQNVESSDTLLLTFLFSSQWDQQGMETKNS